MKGLSGCAIENISFITMWEHFFPKELTWIIINETNKMIESDITIGEFMQFIGILLFMSTVSGFSRREFWSSSPIDGTI
jgi:hypothetical protein